MASNDNGLTFDLEDFQDDVVAFLNETGNDSVFFEIKKDGIEISVDKNFNNIGSELGTKLNHLWSRIKRRFT